jgi:hypothetical protein
MPFNFNIDDIFNIKSRKTTWSKTITLPGTHNNNKIFNHIHRLNSRSNYDPRVRYRAILKKSGLLIIDGFLVLDNIIKNVRDGNEAVRYEVSISGVPGKLFELLKSYSIKDLDFSDYDHDIDDLNTIRLTWPSYFSSGAVSAGMTYVYVNGTLTANQTIDYTAPAVSGVSSVSFEGINRIKLTFGSAHSLAVGDEILIDTDNNKLFGIHTVAAITSTTVTLHTTFASLSTTSATNILVERRIWDSFGYFYPLQDNGHYIQQLNPEGAFNTVPLIKGLLYTVKKYYGSGVDDFDSVAKDPFTGLSMTLADGVTFLADDGTTAPNLAINGAAIPTAVTSGSLISDTIYTITSYASNDDFRNVGGPGPVAINGAWDGVSFLATGPTPTDWSGGSTLSYSSYIYKWSYSILEVYGLKSEDAVLTNKINTVNHWHPGDLIPHIYAREIWQKMFELIGYTVDFPLMDSNVFRRMVMPLDYLYNVEDIPAGPNTVVMNNWLPSMNLANFFISILNIFNMVIKEDPYIKTRITLVGRNDFYSGDTVEWDIDASKDLTIKLSNSLLPKYYYLKYKDSEDFYNSDYVKDFGAITNTNAIINAIDRNYGDYYLDTGNDFNEEPNEVEISFVPTVITSYPDSDKCISVTYSADEEGLDITRKQEIRILIAGYRGTDNPWSFTGITSGQSGDETNPGELDVLSGLNKGRMYPYAAHLDNVYDGVPQIDLNFSVPKGVYIPYSYNATDWAKNTLEGKYWNKYILDIVNPYSKMVTGTFKLKISDINKLDFQNPVKIRNAPYVLKLRKISDWDLNGSGLCKCEFLITT